MINTLFELAKMQLKQYQIYKSNFILFTLNRIVEAAIYIFVWLAIYNQTGSAEGYTLNEIIVYYLLVVSLVPVSTWGLNEDIAYSIRNGRINKELLNPITYFMYYFGVTIGEKIFAILVGAASFVICCIIWQATVTTTLLNFVMFLILILLGTLLTFYIQMIVGTAGFYTDSIWGMTILKKSIISIFSGTIAPLTLFPHWFQSIANILPFRELIYTPINIFLGQVSFVEMICSVCKLVIWIIILSIISKVFFNHAIKKIRINGG